MPRTPALPQPVRRIRCATNGCDDIRRRLFSEIWVSLELVSDRAPKFEIGGDFADGPIRVAEVIQLRRFLVPLEVLDNVAVGLAGRRIPRETRVDCVQR